MLKLKITMFFLFLALLVSMSARPTSTSHANQALVVKTTLHSAFTLDIAQFNMDAITEITPPIYGTLEEVDATTVRYIPMQAGQDYFVLTTADDLLEVAVTVFDAEIFQIGDDLYALERIMYPDAQNTYLVSINDAGMSIGQWRDTSGNTHVMTHAADGQLTTLELDGVNGWQMGHGINNAGVLTGDIADGRRIVSFIMADDGTLTTFAYEASPSTPTFKINDAGQTVGRVADVDGTHGFMRDSDGEFTLFDMPLANPNNPYTWALGINNQQDIVGFYADVDDQFHGFWRLSDGEFATIDPDLATITRLYDINDAGVMVGEYSLGESGTRRRSMEHLNFNPPLNLTVFYGFIRNSESDITTFSIPDAQSTSAWGINNLGQIVGIWVDSEGFTHGYQLTLLSSNSVEFENIVTEEVTSS